MGIAALLLSLGGGAPALAQAPPDSLGSERLEELTSDRVSVFFAPEDRELATRVLSIVDAQRPLPALADSVPGGVEIYLAADQAAFDRLAGGAVPDWTGGVAIPSLSRMVIPTYQSTLSRPGEWQRVLRHEWAHLGLHEALSGLRIPKWLDEGFAEYSAGWDASEAWRLRVALAVGGAPSLDSLSLRWPAGATEARHAYLLSATVVEYLIERSGERGLEILFARWVESGSFEDALRATYGVTSGQLEEDWRRFAEGRYGWLYVLAHSMIFWSMLSVLLVFMVLIRRREKKRRMALLRAQEPPDHPAYWLEPPTFEDGEWADRVREARAWEEDREQS